MIRRVFVIALLAATASPVSAQVENLGAIQPRNIEEAQQIIDTRCTICHTRERIDAAIRDRRDMPAVQQRMVEQGAVLSERDKQVLGTFWGNPLKESAPSPAAPPKGE